jgi:hypothetical protein
MWGALSDERMVLSFTIVAGARQRSHSQVLVPWDLRPYFIFLDSRLYKFQYELRKPKFHDARLKSLLLTAITPSLSH